MGTKLRFIIIFFFFNLAGLKVSKEILPNQKESQELPKSNQTGLLPAWLDLWQPTWKALLDLGPPADTAALAAWPAGH